MKFLKIDGPNNGFHQKVINKNISFKNIDIIILLGANKLEGKKIVVEKQPIYEDVMARTD